MSRGRRITPGERLLIIADAVMTDARTAATKWDVAPTSVWQWAEEVGGLQALRDTYKSREQPRLIHPNVVIARELERRVHRFSNAHMVRLAISMMDDGSGSQADAARIDGDRRRPRRNSSSRGQAR
jgi:hypothetical protein